MPKENGARERGTVKWFNDEKGYGFISRKDGQPDVFVHFRSIESRKKGEFRTLAEGEAVEFAVIQTEKGLAATEVVRIGG